MFTISSYIRPSVFNYFKTRILMMQENGQQGTARTYLATLRCLRRFRNGHDFEFSSVDANFIIDFDAWLQQRGLTRNTLSFYMRIFRAVLNHASDDGYYQPIEPVRRIFRNVYTGIDRTPKRATQLVVLEELLRIDLTQDPMLRRLILARDIFFFSFYTRGMAFVDIAYLRRENIHEGFITYTRHKTNQTLSIGIEPCIRRIVNRYYYRPNSNGYVFPLIHSSRPEEAYRDYRNSLSAYNRALMRLRHLLSIRLECDVPTLSSYVARHTWATLAHDVDVPLRVISQSLGHSNERTTQIYLAQLDREVIDSANLRVLSLINQK